MFVLYLVLFAGACSAYRRSGEHLLPAAPPPYVQSREACSSAQLYLKENLLHEIRNITFSEARKHFSHGILVGVIAECVNDHLTPKPLNKKYNPLLDVYNGVPKAWAHYNRVAADPLNKYIAEVHDKIIVVTRLIDTICTPGDSTEACNNKVDARVQNGTPYLQNRAKLLLLCGAVSKTVNSNRSNLEDISSQYTEIPYLINHVQDMEFTSLVENVADMYRILRPNLF